MIICRRYRRFALRRATRRHRSMFERIVGTILPRFGHRAGYVGRARVKPDMTRAVIVSTFHPGAGATSSASSSKGFDLDANKAIDSGSVGVVLGRTSRRGCSS